MIYILYAFLIWEENEINSEYIYIHVDCRFFLYTCILYNSAGIENRFQIIIGHVLPTKFNKSTIKGVPVT